MRTIEEIKMAWVYYVVCSWDDKSFDEFNQNFGWDKKIFKRLKRLHEQFDEIEKLCTAYRDDRCVVLPCKVLNELWGIDDRNTNGYKLTFFRFTVYHYVVLADVVFAVNEYGHKLSMNLLGKTVFLTREEAEQALKEQVK